MKPSFPHKKSNISSRSSVTSRRRKRKNPSSVSSNKNLPSVVPKRLLNQPSLPRPFPISLHLLLQSLLINKISKNFSSLSSTVTSPSLATPIFFLVSFNLLLVLLLHSVNQNHLLLLLRHLLSLTNRVNNNCKFKLKKQL